MDQNQWYEQGKLHIWHPYTQAHVAPDPIQVIATKDCKLILADGRELIDGSASWWSACHGYNHPHILKSITQQLQKMPHVMFAGIAHEPAYQLAARLAKLTGLDRVFFTDSGSTAIETALKMAAQYWRNQGCRHRDKFVSFSNAYHGDTMGAMSLCDPESGMHAMFHDYMPRQYSVKLPLGEYAFIEFDNLLGDLKNTIAGVVLEPLVQGAGGMCFHTPDVVAEIYRICKKHELLFIADEVMTGFGRTGHLFACDEAGIKPDIMCVGKALTGGVMGLAATIATSAIYEGFLGNDLQRALMSGPTYMANPMACAAANASLDLFETEPRLKQVEAIEKQLYEELQPCAQYQEIVKEVRVKGAIGVVELKDINFAQIMQLRAKFVEKNVWIRPFGNIIYLMPAFTISKEELTSLTSAIDKVLKNWV